MGYTIGDVLTVIGLIFGTLFAIWALMVCFALLFPKKVEKAKYEAQVHPWRALIVGAIFNTVLVIVAGALMAAPSPVAKLIAWAIYLVVLGTMAVGASGIALVAADRIQQTDRRRSGYRSLERGAMLLVVGALLPVFGWFGFAPIMFLLAGGAGFRALYVRRHSPVPSAVVRESAGASSAGSQEFVV